MENLFSYGTLQDDAVQLSTFGRRLLGRPDVLSRYREGRVPFLTATTTIAISGYHLNAEFTGHESDSIAGTVFQITTEELEDADTYEATANYKRIRVELHSGTQAWVYVFDAS